MTFVWGVGTSRFGKQPDRSAGELAWQAIDEALRDADLGSMVIDAVFVGTVFGETGVAQRALSFAGIVGVPVVTVENACASGTTAFHEACAAIAADRYRCVLVLGVETLTERFRGALPPSSADAEGAAGMALPALYALAADRYMHEGWVTPQQLARVSVKNHRHALHNPRAQYSGDFTVDEVLASRMIADPLTLLQCSPLSDAGAAAILGPVKRHRRDVKVAACSLSSGQVWGRHSDHVWGFDLVRNVAKDAYQQAGIEPADIDVLEIHDAFTIGEIVTTEALGLAPPGCGATLVDDGATELGGRHPVNPSGGLLSRGHPLGATGVAQIAEIATQIRGEANGRQVPQANVGLVETMGGGVAGIDGNACVVAVLTS